MSLLSSRYLNAIQTNAPHLLRYLATAFIVNKRRRPQFKDFIKVIQQEQYSYKDPITEFLACVYVNYDFDGAQKKMRESEEVSSLHQLLACAFFFCLISLYIYHCRAKGSYCSCAIYLCTPQGNKVGGLAGRGMGKGRGEAGSVGHLD